MSDDPSEIHASLEILKECGAALRSFWDLFTKFLQSFLYLNFLLMGVFSYFLNSPKSVPDKTISGIVIHPRQGILLAICLIGLVGAAASLIIVTRLAHHGRTFLTVAGNLEEYVRFNSPPGRFPANIQPDDIRFYYRLQKDENEQRNKSRLTMLNAGYVLIGLFIVAWLLGGLLSFGINIVFSSDG
jgi:hypothetical protein